MPFRRENLRRAGAMDHSNRQVTQDSQDITNRCCTNGTLVFDSDRLDVPPGKQPGQFTDLVNRLYSLLAERVLTSATLREQLDSLQAQRELDVDRWVELIHDVEALKIMHRQA